MTDLEHDSLLHGPESGPSPLATGWPTKPAGHQHWCACFETNPNGHTWTCDRDGCGWVSKAFCAEHREHHERVNNQIAAARWRTRQDYVDRTLKGKR